MIEATIQIILFFTVLVFSLTVPSNEPTELADEKDERGLCFALGWNSFTNKSKCLKKKPKRRVSFIAFNLREKKRRFGRKGKIM